MFMKVDSTSILLLWIQCIDFCWENVSLYRKVHSCTWTLAAWKLTMALLVLQSVAVPDEHAFTMSQGL